MNSDCCITELVLSAGIIAGDYVRVRYSEGFLYYECGGRLRPEQRGRVRLDRETDKRLCRLILDCHIESWPSLSDPSLGRILPEILLTLTDGEVIRWRGRTVPYAAWAEIDALISKALGIRFKLEEM